MRFPLLPPTLISPILPRDLNTSTPLPFPLFPFPPIDNVVFGRKTARHGPTTNHLDAETVGSATEEVAVVLAPFEACGYVCTVGTPEVVDEGVVCEVRGHEAVV